MQFLEGPHFLGPSGAVKKPPKGLAAVNVLIIGYPYPGDQKKKEI
jgi:hypothetical protein